ncbi:MAG: DUF4147 domain-containing protein [Paracoccaceae bacterium]
MHNPIPLKTLWRAGVDAVGGANSVHKSLTDTPITPPDQIIAVGKAASAMAKAAARFFPDAPCLVVTKYDHGQDYPTSADLIEAAHPVPDVQSLAGGQALRDALMRCKPGSHLLCLVSGGASALAEVLPEGWSLDRLASETQRMLASGADIHAMNARRKEISQIKGGKLLALFPGSKVTSLAISDVEGDVLGVIGSGIGDAFPNATFTFDARIVASNAIARDAVAKVAGEPLICNEETLYEDIGTLASRLGRMLKSGPAGLYLLGGEPTVILPETPGMGGRNMALGLTLAREMQGADIEILVAGTDGTDGPTDAAGAIVTGQTWTDQAQDALDRADAYPFLRDANALFKSGPTGTNVMDLLIARKR